ncbi:MAG TPA: NAD(P)/FAD-dependent oxidoreductase, partial [SAR86 cluster bacterium]|nr:NAD(P)/FAD-dependent oxidoreductase [SAR86 cluster bacterium]
MNKEKANNKVDVLIVGAGVAGLYMLYKLRGMGFTTSVIEKSDELGGTWNWNRYPGARCDIPSLEYSYQFDEDLQQEWNWSEKYSSGPEILEYLNHVADRFDLRKGINFEEEVIEARFNEDDSLWNIKTNKGDYLSKFCIFATGCLSVPNKP